jgi:hypothetical protein
MSRVINFDKGSKRRFNQIRWNQLEITSAILLSLVLIALCVFFALWGTLDYSIQSQTPQVREQR